MSSLSIQTIRSTPVAGRLEGHASHAPDIVVLTGDAGEILDLGGSTARVTRNTASWPHKIFGFLSASYHLERSMDYIDEGFQLLQSHGHNMPRELLSELVDTHEQLRHEYYASKDHTPLDRADCRDFKHQAKEFLTSTTRLSKESETTGLRKRFKLSSARRTPTDTKQSQSDGRDQLDSIPESSAQTGADGSSHRGDDERCPGIGKSGAEVSSQVADEADASTSSVVATSVVIAAPTSSLGGNRAEEDEKLLEQIAQRNF